MFDTSDCPMEGCVLPVEHNNNETDHLGHDSQPVTPNNRGATSDLESPNYPSAITVDLRSGQLAYASSRITQPDHRVEVPYVTCVDKNGTPWAYFTDAYVAETGELARELPVGW